MPESEENFETLQLVAECHSMNKIKGWSRPVVLEKMQKSEENFETLQLAAECHSMNKNHSLMKTSSSWEKCIKVMKIWKLCN